jgi:hypothetical protein
MAVLVRGKLERFSKTLDKANRALILTAALSTTSNFGIPACRLH